ncbi:Csu type fimbrial protein [Ignatzschineria sp. LJL83]
MKNFKQHALVGLFAASTMFAGLAHAQTQTIKGTVDVRLAIIESCKIEGGGDVKPGETAKLGVLDFGVHAIDASGPVDAGDGTANTGLNIGITCNEDYPNFKVTLVNSDNPNEGSGARALNHVGGASAVPYKVFSDSAKANLLEDGAVVATGMVGGTKTEFSLFGEAQLDGQQSAGRYTDVLNFEIAF